MDKLTISAASGMILRIDTLDLLANNLANANAAGYKSDREAYSLFLSEEATWDQSPTRLPRVEGRWTDFSQGLLKTTNNPTDLALSGDGFFAVNGPDGPLYTRNGSFQLSPKGILETADGYTVETESGKPLQAAAGVALQITRDGVVRQEGVVLDRLKIVRFAEPQTLGKKSGTYFQWVSPEPSGELPATAQVWQGQLKSSNVGPAEGAVKLVNVMRQFEMLQKALTLGGEMNRRAIEEVARVS